MMRGSPFSDRNSKASDKTTINVTDGTLIPLKDEGTLLSAWNISFCGAIALLVLLPVLSPDPYLRILSFVPDGLVATFSVTLVSIFFALLIGLFAGLGRISQKRFINRIATVYVEIIRGIPLLVQLFIWYFVLPELLPFGLGDAFKQKLDPVTQQFVSAMVCLGFFTSARVCEQVRSGINALPRGQ